MTQYTYRAGSINTLDCYSIEGIDFERRDVNIANTIYGYNKGAAVGRFKHPHNGVKIDRTTEDIAASVPPEIMNHYKDIHLDIDILFVNKIPFLLVISWDIRFIHCKVMVSNHSNRVEQYKTDCYQLSIKGIQGCNCFWGQCLRALNQMGTK